VGEDQQALDRDAVEAVALKVASALLTQICLCRPRISLPPHAVFFLSLSFEMMFVPHDSIQLSPFCLFLISLEKT